MRVRPRHQDLFDSGELQRLKHVLDDRAVGDAIQGVAAEAATRDLRESVIFDND